MGNSSINKAIEEIAKIHAANIRRSKIKFGLGTARDDIRYSVLEIFEMLEDYADDIITKRYIGRNALMGHEIKIVILSKIDFSRKISILEEIEDETQIGIPVNSLRFYNNLRNALVHDYPKSHKFFKYKGGHIYNDLKFKDVCTDALALFKKALEIREKITPKSYH